VSTAQATVRRRRSWRVWLGLLLLLILLVAVIATGVGIYTGVLPREILRAALESTLGAHAEVGNTSVLGRPSVENLRISDIGAPQEPPAIDLDGLILDYRLRPEDGRYFEALEVGALRLHFAQDGEGNTNYDFLRRLFDGPGGGRDPLPYVPKQLSIGLESLEVVQPDAAARIGGVQAEMAIEAMDRFSAALTGEAVPVRWRIGDEAEQEPEPGKMAIEAGYDAGAFRLKGTVQLPEFASVDAGATGRLGEGGWAIDATLAPSTLSGAVAGLLPEALLPTPMRFDTATLAEGRFAARGNTEGLTVEAASLEAEIAGLELGPAGEPFLSGLAVLSLSSDEHDRLAMAVALSPAQLTGGILTLLPENLQSMPVTFDTAQIDTLTANLVYSGAGWELPDAAAKGRVEGLVAGPPDAPWFAGNLHVDGAATPASEDLAKFTLALDSGQEAQVTVAAAGWPREQVLAATPEAWRERVASLFPTVDRASATVAYTYTAEGSSMQVEGALGLAGQEGKITLDGRFPTADQAGFNFNGTAALAGGQLSMEGSLPPGGGLVLTARTDGLPLGAWPRLLRPGLMPEGFEAEVKGTLGITHQDDTAQFTAALESMPTAMGGFDLTPLGTVTVNGTGQFDGATSRLGGTALDVGFAEGFQLAAKTWSFDTAKAQLDAQLELGGDIGWLAKLFTLPELYGEVGGSSALTITPTGIRVTPSLTSELLGYGDLAVPYRKTLAATGKLDYKYADRSLAGTDVRLGLDEENRLSAGALRIAAGEFALEGLEVHSDLSPLVAFEYLGKATGNLEARGHLAMAGGAIDAALAGALTAETLVLPGTASRLDGVELTADVTYRDVLQGDGSFSATQLMVGGVTVDGIQSKIATEGDALRFEGARPMVFGGETEVSARAGIFEEGLPILLRVYTHGADLARFTEEFKPPSVILTGIAVGEIIVEITGMTLSDLQVDLVAEEGFSVNRDLVAQALMQQYVVNMPGGVSMQDIIEKTVGKAEQRPFDRGRITLGFEDGRVTGVAILESELLNLTVDIHADPEAIIEAIRMRQQEQAQ
jgi:hypothetical protein